MLSDRSERWKAIKGIGFCSCWKTWKEKFQCFSKCLMTSLNEGFPPVYYYVRFHSLVEHGISLYIFNALNPSVWEWNRFKSLKFFETFVPVHVPINLKKCKIHKEYLQRVMQSTKKWFVWGRTDCAIRAKIYYLSDLKIPAEIYLHVRMVVHLWCRNINNYKLFMHPYYMQTPQG